MVVPVVMCRMFALVSDKVGSREFYDLMGPFKAKAEDHPNGWGIGWYPEGSPKVAKAPNRADKDKELVNTVKEVRSHLILAHIRKASVGAQSMENTHPFQYGKWTFCHNGTFRTRPALREKLPPEYRSRLQGRTDSEELFQWVLYNIAQKKDHLRGIEAAMAWVRGNLGSEVTALNFLLADGKRLYAYRYAYCRPDLYYLAYVSRPSTLSHPNSSVVIASDHLTGEDWRALENGTLLEVGWSEGARVDIKVHKGV